jgi:hypothetical protein
MAQILQLREMERRAAISAVATKIKAEHNRSRAVEAVAGRMRRERERGY